uniref:Uncharacterized protein n=1 Tax=Glossina palpalis gambiensis TaxID=67801 RepID=A0A1B0AKC8_9MUSC
LNETNTATTITTTTTTTTTTKRKTLEEFFFLLSVDGMTHFTCRGGPEHRIVQMSCVLGKHLSVLCAFALSFDTLLNMQITPAHYTPNHIEVMFKLHRVKAMSSMENTAPGAEKSRTDFDNAEKRSLCEVLFLYFPGLFYIACTALILPIVCWDNGEKLAEALYSALHCKDCKERHARKTKPPKLMDHHAIMSANST